MSFVDPVRCARCNAVYNLCEGEPVARYADCTVFIAPCCKTKVDDRPIGWGGSVIRITMAEYEREKGRPYLTSYGVGR